MIPVDALFFDLDGTLIDSKRDLAHAVRVLQKEYQVPLSTELEVGKFIGDGVGKLVERALPALPKSELGEAVSKLKAYYRKHCLDNTYIYPGVLSMLKHFRGKKMAVVTNKPVRISGYILDHLGLSPFFKVLVGGDSLPNKKPHPEPILNAMATMNLNMPKRVVFVGDSSNDILAGRAAKTRTCGIKSNIGDHQNLLNSRPDLVVDNLEKLIRLFR